MGYLLNQKEAMEFIDSIDDPITGTLVGEAYTSVLHSRLSLDGDFDMLFFAKAMAEFLKDRERLASKLKGEFEEDSFDLSDVEQLAAQRAPE